MTEKLLNVSDLAELLGCSRQTIYNHLKTGRCPVEPVEGKEPPQFKLSDAVGFLAVRDAGSETELYRHFDSENRLLYVGVSISAVARLSAHRASSRHAKKIASMTIERFDSRSAALEAETLAIQNEKPLYNIAKNQSYPIVKAKRNEEKTLTVEMVARLIGVSRRTLYNMLTDGRFPVPPISGTSPRRWNPEAVEAWRKGIHQ